MEIDKELDTSSVDLVDDFHEVIYCLILFIRSGAGLAWDFFLLEAHCVQFSFLAGGAGQKELEKVANGEDEFVGEVLEVRVGGFLF